MPVFTARARELPAEQRRALASYRRRVFVDRLGWPLAVHDGGECDQFDLPDTVHALALGQDGALQGCARLLPTTGAYLARSVFGCRLYHVPAERQTWELTRFAAATGAVTGELLRACFLYAARQGARRLLTISPCAIVRLLRRRGVAYRTLSAPFSCEGRSYRAFLLDIPSFYCVATKTINNALE